MRLLITGGAGYIGSHTCVELQNFGHEVVIVDNLSNSKTVAIDRIGEITGQKPVFYQVDLLDRPGLEEIFQKHQFDAVIHFAGLKAVGESVKLPLLYYHNNVTGSVVLLETMAKFNVKNIVFSSSACVYGQPVKVPIAEDHPLSPENPYGWSKVMIEQILKDTYAADNSWNIAILRYFNPVGAHLSGKIGEDPKGIPNNLTPYIAQVAIGKLPSLSVYGHDYPTPDGTGVRDYIHITDLAIGHLKALEKLSQKPGVVIYNLGTGVGVSVLEVIKAFEKASGKTIPYQFAPRRPGDTATVYADPALAEKALGWKAKKTIDEMCADVWRWQSQNPQGYPD